MKPSMQRLVRRFARHAGVPGLPALDPAAATRRIRERLAAAGLSLEGTSGPATSRARRAASARRSADTVADAPGAVRVGRFTSRQGERDWRLFVPASVADGTSVPLIVMLHGCTQDAADFARGTRMDAIAAEYRCLVLYPEQSVRANPQRCWNWFKHSHQSAARGEPALLLGLIREIADAHGVDRERIFAAGLSAGGAMAAILGSVAPDVIAGIGVHSGLGAGSARDVSSAFAAMQGQGTAVLDAHGAPAIVLHGDADGTVHPSNGIAIADACTRDAAGLLKRTRQVQENGRRVEVTGWDDLHSGAARVEHWSIDGAGHAWSGGDPAGSYTDAAGPEASRVMLDFFLRRSRAGRRAA